MQFCAGWRRAALIFGCLVLGACGLSQGIAEFEIYRSAFEKTYGTSTAILDQLAVQERELFLRSRRGRIDLSTVKFDPNLASYYTDTVDPPGTAGFCTALETRKGSHGQPLGWAAGPSA